MTVLVDQPLLSSLLSQAILDALVETGTSNRALARQTGVTEKHLSRVLCGWDRASLPLFETWARALGYRWVVRLERIP
jgi:lambda repressor-like predicted transcriptional regulator